MSGGVSACSPSHSTRQSSKISPWVSIPPNINARSTIFIGTLGVVAPLLEGGDELAVSPSASAAGGRSVSGDSVKTDNGNMVNV